jgi:hypothetical protein
LGANIGTWSLGDGRNVWSMSASSYIKSAVANIETELANESPYRILRSKAYRPMKSGYRPEIDVTPLLTDDMASYYQGLIGILQWVCEIGRIDILTEVSMLSSHNAMPREGHLDAVLDIFAYLKQHPQAAILFDESEPNIDERRFKKVDWSDIYGPVQEELPPGMPIPLGNPVSIHCFVDADHAGNLATRRSHTGIIIFINMSPIIWYSKRQNTVESSTFGSEFVALRTAVELIIGLRYKLRMFGVPINHPANVFCNNLCESRCQPVDDDDVSYGYYKKGKMRDREEEKIITNVLLRPYLYPVNLTSSVLIIVPITNVPNSSCHYCHT